MVAILVTPPQAEPVSLDEAKMHVRIDGTAEDGLMERLIAAARTDVESRTGRAMVSQGWRIVLDRVPANGSIRLAPAPVASVEAVTVYAEDGEPTVLDAADYALDAASAPGRLKLVHGRFWGARAMNGVEVDFTCGYGAPAEVPAPLRQAVLMLVAYWYEQREAAVVGAVAGAVAHGVGVLTAPFRMPRLA